MSLSSSYGMVVDLGFKTELIRKGSGYPNHLHQFGTESPSL